MVPRNFALLALIAFYIVMSGALFFAFGESAAGACASGFNGGWAACDQTHHLGLINELIERPSSLFDYADPWLIATVPGFHVIVAVIARSLGIGALGPDTWLRLIPFGFGFAVVSILWRVYRDLSDDSAYAGLLCLPILWSNYFYLSSLFLVTENQAYLGYAFLLMAYLRFPGRGLAVGAAAAAMVSARQIFLPVIASHLFAFAGAPLGRPLDRERIRAILMGALPPVAIVLAFAFAWHGLVPPEVRRLHSARAMVEPGPVVQAVGLLGVLALPYGFLAYPAMHALGRRRIVAILAFASIASLALWLVAPTSRDLDAGRAGSFVWLLARASPMLGEHALAALPILLLGFAAGGFMVELARARRAVPVELVMFALYVAALSMQLLSYQRYSEVVTLITLSATVARLAPPRRFAITVFVVIYAAKLVTTLVIPQPG